MNLLDDEGFSVPNCPTGCGQSLDDHVNKNYKSRYYTGVYVCPACGVKERTHGMFWNAPLRSISVIIKVQRKWIKWVKEITNQRRNDDDES